MEKELNIANILKDKPNGTKLYANAFGELSLERVKVNEVDAIYTKNKTSTLYCFYNDGKYNKNGESILVPSKKMRDWNKFAWKKGDILVSADGKSHVIFSRWYDDNYISFYGKHYPNKENKDKAIYCVTEKFSLENKDIAKDYISSIEEKFDGKLNLKTLEIDKSQLEFKDGDIIANPAIKKGKIMKEINVKVTIVYDNKSFYDDKTVETIIKSVIGNSLFKITLNKDIVIHKIDVTNNEK